MTEDSNENVSLQPTRQIGATDLTGPYSRGHSRALPYLPRILEFIIPLRRCALSIEPRAGVVDAIAYIVASVRAPRFALTPCVPCPSGSACAFLDRSASACQRRMPST